MMLLVLPLRLIVAIVVIAVLANFVIYGTQSDPLVDAVSGWRESSLEAQTPQQVNAAKIAGFLGSEARVAAADNLTTSGETSPGARTLVYEGVTYRLTGLVVNGTKSAATLSSETSDPVRVVVGGQLPGGQKVRAITLNEIVVIKSDGGEERIRIYE